ncbi:MAG: DUF4398 domain-containing protein [Treponema sp.]|nr:DUF4398 domain-containing protein [Treponema sp.]
MRKIGSLLIILLVLAVGCVKPPTEEMENARDAVFRAQNDPAANEYAMNTLVRARIAIQRMDEEAANKNFDMAKTHAAEAIALAQRAINEGKQGAGRSETSTSSAVINLRPEIEETQRNINGARYSNLKLDYDALDRDMIKAHNDADRAEASQADGRVQEAQDIAREVRANLAAINQKVAGAASSRKK